MLCIDDLMLLSHVYYDTFRQCCFHRCSISTHKLKKKYHDSYIKRKYYMLLIYLGKICFFFFSVHMAEGSTFSGMTLYNIYYSNF